MDDCCFCRDGDNTSLTTASSKGIKSLTEIASSRNDLVCKTKMATVCATLTLLVLSRIRQSLIITYLIKTCSFLKQAIINLVRTRTEIRYHRKCYIYYIRYNPGEDKENAPHHSKTPTRIQREYAVARVYSYISVGLLINISIEREMITLIHKTLRLIYI